MHYEIAQRGMFGIVLARIVSCSAMFRVLGSDLVSAACHCPRFFFVCFPYAPSHSLPPISFPLSLSDNSYKFPTSLNAALSCLGPT